MYGKQNVSVISNSFKSCRVYLQLTQSNSLRVLPNFALNKTLSDGGRLRVAACRVKRAAIVTLDQRYDDSSSSVREVGWGRVGWGVAFSLNGMNVPNWINVLVYMVTVHSRHGIVIFNNQVFCLQRKRQRASVRWMCGNLR